MLLQTLSQPCNNSTLLGCVSGAAKHYGLPVSPAMLCGLSGHAWLINIHRQLCPSGPYCWDRAPFFKLLANAGLATEPLGFFWTEGGAMPRAELEQRLRGAVDEGLACYLVNMEYQLILGYDETGFVTAQPWAPHVDFPPKHLTFETWSELGSEIHIDFYITRPTPAKELGAAIAESFDQARGMWSEAADGTTAASDYGLGPRGYDYWIQAVRDGHGDSHGNWWNGTVYAECRDHAAGYLREVGNLYPHAAAVANELAEGYARVSEWLKRAADKALPADDKIAILTQAAALERDLVTGLAGVRPE